MKRMVFTLAAIMVLVYSSAFSQGDSTLYINGLPVSEDDTVQQFPAQEVPPTDKLKPVGVPQLPDEVREALEEQSQYSGWRDSTIYFEENTGLYLVPVKYEGGVRIFGLDENGEPVTYDEVANE
jgi:hypothetical protein